MNKRQAKKKCTKPHWGYKEERKIIHHLHEEHISRIKKMDYNILQLKKLERGLIKSNQLNLHIPSDILLELEYANE